MINNYLTEVKNNIIEKYLSVFHIHFANKFQPVNLSLFWLSNYYACGLVSGTLRLHLHNISIIIIIIDINNY